MYIHFLYFKKIPEVYKTNFNFVTIIQGCKRICVIFEFLEYEKYENIISKNIRSLLLVNVHMPKDRVTQMHQGYGFVEFMGEEDADYAIKIMNMIKLYGKPIRVNKASAHQKNLDVGANIFIGNLDPEVDEKLLYDTFSAFGVILQTPKVHTLFI